MAWKEAAPYVGAANRNTQAVTLAGCQESEMRGSDDYVCLQTEGCREALCCGPPWQRTPCPKKVQRDIHGAIGTCYITAGHVTLLT